MVRLAVGPAVILLAAVVVLVTGRPALAGSASRPAPARYHVVLPGETLMGIAARQVSGVDPRDAVIRIIALNALPGSGIRVGDRLALPVTG